MLPKCRVLQAICNSFTEDRPFAYQKQPDFIAPTAFPGRGNSRHRFFLAEPLGVWPPMPTNSGLQAKPDAAAATFPIPLTGCDQKPAHLETSFTPMGRKATVPIADTQRTSSYCSSDDTTAQAYQQQVMPMLVDKRQHSSPCLRLHPQQPDLYPKAPGSFQHPPRGLNNGVGFPLSQSFGGASAGATHIQPYTPSNSRSAADTPGMVAGSSGLALISVPDYSGARSQMVVSSSGLPLNSVSDYSGARPQMQQLSSAETRTGTAPANITFLSVLLSSTPADVHVAQGMHMLEPQLEQHQEMLDHMHSRETAIAKPWGACCCSEDMSLEVHGASRGSSIDGGRCSIGSSTSRADCMLSQVRLPLHAAAASVLEAPKPYPYQEQLSAVTMPTRTTNIASVAFVAGDGCASTLDYKHAQGHQLQQGTPCLSQPGSYQNAWMDGAAEVWADLFPAQSLPPDTMPPDYWAAFGAASQPCAPQSLSLPLWDFSVGCYNTRKQ